MSKLKGKVAVITGGSSGIGLATAKRFVAEGAYVFITGRRQSELDKAFAEIGNSVTAVQGDVAKLEDLNRLYEVVAKTKGKIDILFANAGIVEPGPTATATPEHFDKIFGIDARGLYFTVQKALPLLNDGSSIVLTGAGLAVKGFPGFGAYAAAKAALRSFTRTWTAELKDRKLRVNIVSPGPVDTPLMAGLFPSKEVAERAKAQLLAMIPLGRVASVEDVASAVLFLASDESSYIAGIDLPVDGGATAV